MIKAVYVYQGLGASKQGCEHLCNALRSNLVPETYSVGYINPEEIINGVTLENARLIAFGGGFTSGFAQALGDSGMRKLMDYVRNGGSYLGFGAGGYFGSDRIEFDLGGPFEKIAERELRLYPGIGRGPSFPGFEYGTNKGVHSALVVFESPSFSRDFHAYIDGGGAFYPSDPPKPGSEVVNVVTLATFKELGGNPAAIVKTNVGSRGGAAVLSGVHLEYDTLSTVNSDSTLTSLRDQFDNSRQSQREAFRSVLRMLELDLT